MDRPGDEKDRKDMKDERDNEAEKSKAVKSGSLIDGPDPSLRS
jgi:hypothetical protein